MRKKLIIIGVVLAIVGGLAFWGLDRLRRVGSAALEDMQTVAVQRGPLLATVDTAGTVEMARSVSLVFQASGQVQEVAVSEGDAVKAGQVIARLDTTDAELQVAQAEASLAVAEAQLALAKKGSTAEDIASAQAALASAEEGLKRLQAGATAEEVEIARLRWEQAKDQLWSAQASRDATCGNPMAGGSACDQAEAAVAAAEMAAEIARVQYEQTQKGAGDSELRAAEAQVAQARANLARLVNEPSAENLRVAEAGVAQAEAAVALAKRALEQCALTAPFDGTLSRLDLQVGQVVGPSTIAGVLSGDSRMQIAADMSEVDVARVAQGQQVEITLDALPDRTFKGHVADVAPAGVSTQGVVNFPVTIVFDEADPAIRPGMTANISIIVERRENVLLVPSRAIHTQGSDRVVYVLEGSQIEEIPVQVGMSGDSGTEILDDSLSEGQEVIVSGGLFFQQYIQVYGGRSRFGQ